MRCYLLTGILLCAGLLAAHGQEEDVLNVDALLEDDALLDALLFGDAELPGELTTLSSSLWDVEHRLLLGGGYKTNTLFSAFSEEDSAFALTEWESTVFRLGKSTDWKFLGYVLVENRHYADVEGLDNEWLGIALAQIDKPLGRWQVGLAGQYMFLEQAFSLEFEELDLGQTSITLHQFTVTPRAEVKLTDATTLGLRLPMAFNRFQDSAQNYDEVAVVTDLRVALSDRVKLSLAYGYEKRDYADRVERDRQGNSLVGEGLSWEEHQVDLRLEVYLDKAKHWRSKTVFRHRLVQDSGSGFNDFAMTKVAQTLAYQNDPWSIAVTGSYTHYDYPVQTKDAGDSNRRHRSRLGLGLETKRKFGAAWEGVARYAFESYLSNVAEDQYDVHVFTLGLHHTF